MEKPKIRPKVVRDNIPSFAKNDKVEFATLNDAEFYEALKEKLIEEAKELDSASGEHEIEEIADVYEVLDRIVELRGSFYEDKIDKTTMKKRIETARKNKRAYKGGFKSNLFMYGTSVIS